MVEKFSNDVYQKLDDEKAHYAKFDAMLRNCYKEAKHSV